MDARGKKYAPIDSLGPDLDPMHLHVALRESAVGFMLCKGFVNSMAGLVGGEAQDEYTLCAMPQTK